jgi:hypothetical protein
MTEQTMTPDEVLAVLDRNAKDADAARFRIKGHEAWEHTKRCRVESAEARTAVAALIAERDDTRKICDAAVLAAAAAKAREEALIARNAELEKERGALLATAKNASARLWASDNAADRSAGDDLDSIIARAEGCGNG